MDLTETDKTRYLEALYRDAGHPIEIKCDVLLLVLLVGSVQLALRHPNYPPTSRHMLQSWLADVHRQLTTLNPVLGLGILEDASGKEGEL